MIKDKLFWVIVALFSILLFFAIKDVFAANWKANPADCPVEYNDVSCTGSERQCGINTAPDPDNPYCYEPLNLNPGQNSTSNAGDMYDSDFIGGFILNCEETDSDEPYCDSSPPPGDFWCNRNVTCYSTFYRQTRCVNQTWSDETGASVCMGCRTGYDDCTGDTVCECDLGTTDCATCGMTSGVNNYATACATCVCDTGYRNCGDILVVNNPEDSPGCNDDYSGGGRDDCSVLGAYSASNTGIDSSCDCVCLSGYQSCSAPDTSGNPETSGCNTTTTGTSDCTTDGFYAVATNNHINTTCGCSCDATHEDCDASGPGVSTGCEYEINEVCDTNAKNLTGCVGCTCDPGHSDCNANLGDGVDGCEVENFVTACSLGSASGTYDDSCGCQVAPFNWTSGGAGHGQPQNYYTQLNESMFYGIDHGLGMIVNQTNSAQGSWWYMNGSMHMWLSSLISCDADNEKIETDANGLFYCGVAISGSGGGEANRPLNETVLNNETGYLTITESWWYDTFATSSSLSNFIGNDTDFSAGKVNGTNGTFDYLGIHNAPSPCPFGTAMIFTNLSEATCSSFLTTGDSLGNHTAYDNLSMDNFSIENVRAIYNPGPSEQNNFSIKFDTAYLHFYTKTSSNNLFIDWVTPGSDDLVFLWDGSTRYKLTSAGTFFNVDLGMAQAVTNGKFYMERRTGLNPTNTMLVEGQRESATCAGADCVGGDLILSGGAGTIGGELLLEKGGTDGSGDTAVRVNDTQTYVHTNLHLDDNLTVGSGLKMYDNGSCFLFSYEVDTNFILCK